MEIRDCITDEGQRREENMLYSVELSPTRKWLRWPELLPQNPGRTLYILKFVVLLAVVSVVCNLALPIK